MKSFLAGRTQIPLTPLQPLPGAPAREPALRIAGHAHAPSKNGAAPAAAPTVECIKQGDKVVRLVVTCGCGERIEIECLYPGVG